MNTSQRVPKPRNFVAINPLMKKGGVHQVDNKHTAQKRDRYACKQNLRKTDWMANF